MAGHTVDWKAVVAAAVTPGGAGNRIASAYKRRLFGDRTLQDLPDAPRFVFNATNLQSGVLWRFEKPYMADYRVGVVPQPEVPLATAVAASSAFPPFLSPLRLSLDPDAFEPGSGEDMQVSPYTRRAVLTDGGVYDNLGLEAAFKRYSTVLISDGGGQIKPSKRVRSFWPAQLLRVTSVIDNQVRSLRKREAIEDFEGDWDGAYWGIRTQIADYGLRDSLPCDSQRTQALAETPTRLAAMRDELQERLINWGYAVCDAALRRHVNRGIAPPGAFPYPGGV
jgi:NTE family protein